MARISVDLATVFPDKWAGLTIGKHTLQVRAKNPGNYLDSDLSTAINFYKTVPITVTAINCTAASNNPTEFPDVGGDETILTFNKKTGYTLPETIVITGVAGQNIGYSWTVADSGTYAELKILKALGDITVTVTGVAETYNITTNLTHAIKESGPSTIAYGANATLVFSFPTGYEAPDKTAIRVTGADFSWEKGTGTMVLTNAQGAVNIELTGVATTTTIDGGTYKWHDNTVLSEWTQEINFTSNGTSYSGMRYTGNGTAMTLQYRYGGSDWVTVYNYDEDASTGSWVNDAYKIVDLGTSAQTVTAIFKADFVANTTKLTQLATPQNVTADGTTVSWNEVKNATSYEVLADGASIGEYSVSSGYTVTLTSWDENVAADDGAAVKFNTPPTSENDYDYRTGKLYDDTGLYNASGAKVTQPIIVDGVSKVYVFMYGNYGTSAGGYKLNGGSVEYGGEWSNPAVISLTENSTLSLLHAQD